MVRLMLTNNARKLGYRMMKLKVMLINEDQARRSALQQAVESDGHSVVAQGTTTAGLLLQIQKVRPELLIIETPRIDEKSLQALAILNQQAPLPVIVMTESNDDALIIESVHAGVSAYVVAEDRYERIGPIMQAALARFTALQKLRSELERTKSTLAERKTIERAKGILMKQRGYSEDEAYHALRKLAMNRNKRLGEMAENVISAADLLV